MKIAIYHPWIYLKSGLERTILEIARRSRHEFVIYTSHYDQDGTYPELKQYDIRQVNRVSVERNYGAVLQAGIKIARTRLELEGFDALVICCDGLGSFLNIRNSDLPVVNLCFTPLRAIYDTEYRLRHRKMHKGKRALSTLLDAGYKFADRLLWKRYDKVICISETVKERVLEFSLVDLAKIEIIYPGIDEKQIERCSDHQNYFFCPGRIMWTKNLALAIESFMEFRRRSGAPFRLIIAGMVDSKSSTYFQELQAMAAGHPEIEFVIEPSDAEMQELYRHCFATIFTAFNEDLGLTPMEAMSKAKPVIAVNRGGPREVVVNNETGYLVDNDPGKFAQAMCQLAEQPEEAARMGEAGLERVKMFTWQQFVESFDESIAGLSRQSG